MKTVRRYRDPASGEMREVMSERKPPRETLRKAEPRHPHVRIPGADLPPGEPPPPGYFEEVFRILAASKRRMALRRK